MLIYFNFVSVFCIIALTKVTSYYYHCLLLPRKSKIFPIHTLALPSNVVHRWDRLIMIIFPDIFTNYTTGYSPDFQVQKYTTWPWLAAQLLEHSLHMPRLRAWSLIRSHSRIINEYISKWNNKSMFHSLFLSSPFVLSLKPINWKKNILFKNLERKISHLITYKELDGLCRTSFQ